MSAGELLAPDGSCKTFDTAVDGYARAEAITAIYVKPLTDALRDGNPCHGTGTPTGDPIETTAVGHSEGSAGLSSIIKCVLALEHNTIPPNIKLKSPNPKIPFSKYNLTVPLEPTPFPPDREARVSINSFGIGGSNAHVILESHVPERDDQSLQQGKEESEVSSSVPPSLLLLSANTEVSLQKQVENHQNWVCKHPESVANLAYTRMKYREHLPHRAFIILDGVTTVKISNMSKTPSYTSPLVLVFNGQGAQWPAMARNLIQNDSAFHADLFNLDSALQKLRFPPSWSIINELLKPAETTQIFKSELSQPLCTAVQLALFNKFASLGISPTAVVGHSSGEIAAAYAAGYLSMEEAIMIAYYRGYVTSKQNPNGSMVAVGMGALDVSKYLCDGVVVACENSPSSSTISGDTDRVAQVVEAIKQNVPDVFVRQVNVNMAYHSHPNYWAENLTSPVKFSGAVSNLLAVKGPSTFLEIGPHSTLAGSLRQICSTLFQPFHYVAAQSRGQNSFVTYLEAVGKLYQEGIPLSLGSLFPNGKALSGLPTYPWDHNTSHWLENRISKSWRFRKYPQHCLLGSRNFEGTDTEPQWRNILRLEDEPWISDHKLHHDVVFPFAGYIAMAGEAIRQLRHLPRGAGYRLRHVVAHKALLLRDPTEIVTSLRNYQLGDTENSEWYHFDISSHNGSAWVKHCAGQVSKLESIRESDWYPQTLLRKVDRSHIYDRLASVGFVYGPEFRGLSNVTSSTSEELAHAQIINRDQQSRSPFTLHPATIDAGLQLLLVAQARGLGRNLVELVVPTVIEELEVSSGTDVMSAKAWKLYGVEPCVEFLTGHKVTFRASGIRFQALEDSKTCAEPDVHAAARLMWLPHFDFVNASTLLTPPKSNRIESQMQEELTLLCILETAEKVRYLRPGKPHFARFRDWLNQQIGFAAAGNYKLVHDSEQFVVYPKTCRQEKIEELTAALLGMPQKAFTIGLRRLFDNTEKIFKGEAAAIETLLQDDILARIYDVMTFDYSNFLRILTHTRPTLRILEVGAGTGGTTETILRSMAHVKGAPAYSVYTFTDISAGFFPAATKRFSYASNMEFKVLDISQDPAHQGFERSTYDLVIAANVIHATPSLQKTLSNIRYLLNEDGMLVMTELCSLTRSSNYIFGNFSGWWLGEEDGRPNQPYVPVSRWDEELKAAGYTGVDAVTYDDNEPYRRFAAIVAKKKLGAAISPTSVTLLSENQEIPSVVELATTLEKKGWLVAKRTIGEDIPQNQHVISCLDLDGNFFEDIPEGKFYAFQKFSRALDSTKVLWLTSPVQVGCSNPASAQTLGVARTLRSELGLNFYTLEVDDSEPRFSTLVSSVFEKVIQDEDNENLEPDKEYVINDGVICVGRYQPFSLLKEAAVKSSSARGEMMKKIVIDKPGVLETMTWRILPLPEDLAEDEVEIEVRSSGLNFRDVVYAMGLISTLAENLSLGMEVSGTVRRLGSAVVNFSIGDRVMCFTHEGGFSTHAVVKDHYVHKIPDSMSFQEAATMQSCFTTVIYALLDVGRMRKGTSVLIHSACGGIGLAAIQVVQMMDGVIYATVGNERKRNYLVEKYNIPPERIFNSRDISFLDGLMQCTAGRGVDLVLNSLTGELLHASWKCVAKFGSLLELGKRDLAGFGKLDMSRFLDNRSYCGIDVMYLITEQPLDVKDILERTLEFWKQGKLRALEPVMTFPAAEIKHAFRHLQGGNHIGKVVLNLPDDVSALEATATTWNIRLDPCASYLLVGGFGGLGRVLAVWLAERGAKSLVFLSRSDMAGCALSTELESMGCTVTTVSGSVNRIDDVKEAIKMAPKPTRGVFHLAMVQRDSPLLDMKWTDWKDVNEPKVHGTWNLHRAFLGQQLDYFWLASSTVTVVDQPGQGNYKAGCTFIESFCQYRRSLGLPASVLSICPIKDVGFVATTPAAARSIKLQGLYMLGEKEFLESVEASLLNSAPERRLATGGLEVLSSAGSWAAWKNDGHIIMGLGSELHLDDPKNPTNWRRDRRMGAYHNQTTGNASDALAESNDLRLFLQSVKDGDSVGLLEDEESIDFLTVEIRKKINDFLLKQDTPSDTSLSLAEMGLDSLTAIELRRWFRQAFGLQVSVLEMMGAVSLKQLAETVASRLKEKLGC
ncbi:hypothetical protein ACHAQD_003744 [Fusarium lateritium]